MSESRLLRRRYNTSREGDRQGIKCWLPAIRPALTASSRRVQTHDRQVHALECCVGIREMTPGLHRFSDPGIHALDGIGGIDDGADLLIEAQERHELGPGVLPQLDALSVCCG